MMYKSNEYRRINLDKISFADKTVSMDSVLKNVTPTTSVSEVKITKAEKDYKNRCVKLETSY